MVYFGHNPKDTKGDLGERNREGGKANTCVTKLVIAMGSWGLVHGDPLRSHTDCLGRGRRGGHLSMTPLSPQSRVALGAAALHYQVCVCVSAVPSHGILHHGELESSGPTEAGCCQVVCACSWGLRQGLQCELG